MRILFTLFVSLSLAGLPLLGQAKRVDDVVLKNAGKAASDGDWLSYGLTPGESRYSPLKQIDSANAQRLGLAWSFEIGPGGGNQEATPLAYDGIIYSVTNYSVVFAVDARTGKEKWRWDPEVNQKATADKMCCGVVNRGIAIYHDKVYVPVNDGRLLALDINTGRPVWEARVTYPQLEQSLTMAPRIAKGKVVVGISGGDRPTRGFFAAYNADTGALAWKDYTVPGDPSKGFESEDMRKAAATWDKDWWKLGGGGAVWDGMAFDPDTDLFYVGVGNAEPWPQSLRTHAGENTDVASGKDNLYTASILAVDINTGKIKWHFQATPGDSWDFDAVQDLILAEVNVKGKNRKVLMQANRNGFFYTLDRVTGEFLAATPYAKINWATGVDEKTGRPFVNPAVRYGKSPVSISPGGGGAHNWAPMSYNAGTGLVYIPSAGNTSFTFSADLDFKPDSSRVGGASQIGLNMNTRGMTPEKPPSIGPDPIEGGATGVLTAFDPVKQEIRWRAPGGGAIGGGTSTTAGNLVFQTTPDGRFLAYSADKGEKLYEVNTGLGNGMGPPITFSVDGKQYVALAGGIGPRQGPPGRGPARPVLKPHLLVFALDGKAELPKAEAPTPAPTDAPHQ
jgi:quinohemoprotein ethanol dehydrogenase